MKTLRDLLLSELSDMYDAEQRLVKALPQIARAATCDDLKDALETHLEETASHVKKLEKVFECFDQKARAKTCKATIGLLEEVDDIAKAFEGSPAINAALIAAAQKVEHYEIAAYGTLHEWAVLLKNHEAADLLQEILEEEKIADNTLTERARASSNEEALDEADDEDAEDSHDTKPEAKRKTAVR